MFLNILKTLELGFVFLSCCCRGQQQGQQQQQGGMNRLIGTVIRFALMWYMMTYFKGSQQPAATPAGAAAPLYRKGDLVDMYVYISESPFLNIQDRSNAELIWLKTEIPLAAGPEQTGSFVYRPTEVGDRDSQLVLLRQCCTWPFLQLDTLAVYALSCSCTWRLELCCCFSTTRMV
jgi:hypothetical protein